MKNFGLIVLVLLIGFCSCSKKDNDPLSKNTHNHLSGTLYFEWADEGIQKIDLKTGRKSTVLPDQNDLHGWDVSQDNKKILQATNDPDNLYADLYTYTQIGSGKIVFQFSYSPPSRYTGTRGYISFDEKRIAIPPDVDYGILILDREGNELYDVKGYEGQAFDNNTEIVWMPDNTLLFTLGKNIYQTNASFTKAKLIKTLNFKEWGDLCVSPDGKKIAFYGGTHIWMINSDGSNMTQVTMSNYKERHPAFSPNSHYLVLGSEWGGVFGGIGYITIVPADGKTYNVSWDKPSDETIFIKDPEEDNKKQAFVDHISWR